MWEWVNDSNGYVATANRYLLRALRLKEKDINLKKMIKDNLFFFL